MNYNALTLEEVARMATTDEGARQYLAENAEEVLIEAEATRDDYLDGMFEDSFQAGKDEGWSEARKDLKERFETELKWAVDRLEKQAQLEGNGKRLLEFLQSMHDLIT